jgi:hypothetical protein
MKFVAPDTCLEDYTARRRAFVATLPHEPKERLRRLKEWTDANSPYSPSEKLANLRKALLDAEE